VRVAFGWDGAIDVLHVGDRVMSNSWVTGEAAIRAYELYDEAKLWAVPAWPRNPVSVRTPDEARLYCAVNTADIEAERGDGQRLQIRARTPTSRYLFVFAVDGPQAHGTSRVLDAADFVLFASAAETALPGSPSDTTAQRRGVHAKNLRLATLGLLEALKSIPEGEDITPLGIYLTRAGEFTRMHYPDRFRRSTIEQRTRQLQAIETEWRELSAALRR